MLCLKGNKICCGLQVDFSVPMGSSAQWQYHHPQQPIQGQFTPVSGPSQLQGSPYFQPTGTAQPTPPKYIGRVPPGYMPQYQTQISEPRVRGRKKTRVKDPNSNKDVTREILNRQPSGSLTRSTGGTPNNVTPYFLGQYGSSSSPPLTLLQEAEANVRAQFAAQVAATLAELAEPTESAEEVPVDLQVTETNVSAQHTEESEDLPSVLKVEDAVASEKVNGLDGNINTTTAAPKKTVDAHATGWYHQRWCAT